MRRTRWVVAGCGAVGVLAFWAAAVNYITKYHYPHHPITSRTLVIMGVALIALAVIVDLRDRRRMSRSDPRPGYIPVSGTHHETPPLDYERAEGFFLERFADQYGLELVSLKEPPEFRTL